MKALRIHARQGPAGLVYESAPAPEPGTGDVLVEVHAASYTPGELQWPSTWIDRSGHDRTPIIPCHELSGVVSSLGFGATGLSVGDEVYGGALTFVDLEHQPLPKPDEISLVFDTVGGQTLQTVADALNRQTRLVSIVDPAAAESVRSQGVFFVVEPDRDALTQIAAQVDTGLLRPVTRRSCALSDGRELIQAKDTSHVSGKCR